MDIQLQAQPANKPFRFSRVPTLAAWLPGQQEQEQMRLIRLAASRQSPSIPQPRDLSLNELFCVRLQDKRTLVLRIHGAGLLLCRSFVGSEQVLIGSETEAICQPEHLCHLAARIVSSKQQPIACRASAEAQALLQKTLTQKF